MIQTRDQYFDVIVDAKVCGVVYRMLSSDVVANMLIGKPIKRLMAYWAVCDLQEDLEAALIVGFKMDDGGTLIVDCQRDKGAEENAVFYYTSNEKPMLYFAYVTMITREIARMGATGLIDPKGWGEDDFVNARVLIDAGLGFAEDATAHMITVWHQLNDRQSDVVAQARDAVSTDATLRNAVDPPFRNVIDAQAAFPKSDADDVN